MATVSFDQNTLTISIQLTPTEAGILASTGQGLDSFQGQFDTYIAGIMRQQAERDRVTVRAAIDAATPSQLQAAKIALGVS